MKIFVILLLVFTTTIALTEAAAIQAFLVQGSNPHPIVLVDSASRDGDEEALRVPRSPGHNPRLGSPPIAAEFGSGSNSKSSSSSKSESLTHGLGSKSSSQSESSSSSSSNGRGGSSGSQSSASSHSSSRGRAGGHGSKSKSSSHAKSESRSSGHGK